VTPKFDSLIAWWLPKHVADGTVILKGNLEAMLSRHCALAEPTVKTI
jgi:hypothetical protein